jgi:hypothetical protein
VPDALAIVPDLHIQFHIIDTQKAERIRCTTVFLTSHLQNTVTTPQQFNGIAEYSERNLVACTSIVVITQINLIKRKAFRENISASITEVEE